jgi:fatty-acyl-CoA synthase
MIRQEQVTIGAAVPTIWGDLLRYLDGHPEADVSTVREVAIGGAACPPALMRAFQERYGITVLHAWGMTEMSPLGTVAVPPADAVGEDAWRYRETQGRLVCPVDARLVGPDERRFPGRRERR